MAARRNRWVSSTAAGRIVVGLILSILLAGFWMQYQLFDLEVIKSTEWYLWPIFFALYVISDQLRVEVYFGRQQGNFSLTLIPLVMAVFILEPSSVALIVLASAIPKAIGVRKLTPVKLFFNVASGIFENTLFIYLFYQFGFSDIANPISWVATVAAAVIATFTALSVLVAAIATLEGEIESRVMWTTIIVSAEDSLVGPVIAICILLALQTSVWAVIPLVALGSLGVLGYRRFTASLVRLRTTESLFEITESISIARQEKRMADAMLTKTRELLRCETASLWLPASTRYPELGIRAQESNRGVVDDLIGNDDILRMQVIETGETFAASRLKSEFHYPKGSIRAAFEARECKDLMIVALRSGGVVIGCIEVANRIGELVTFKARDKRVLEVLAAHVGIMLENMRLVDRLQHDAYHDSLTGLTNRRGFLEAFEESISVRQGPSEVVAVTVFDVDAMRDVNETLGHYAGDRLLKEVARRLEAHAPPGALVARLDGDKLAVLVRTAGSEAAQTQAELLQQALTEPLHFDSYTLDVGTAVGIVLYPEHGGDVSTLMQRADVAIRSAKQDSRTIQLYRASMESKSVQHLGLVSELRRALEDGSLMLHYQPKISLDDMRLVGVEALVRWEHPEQGIIPPDDFISVAESTGLIGALTRYVITEALAQNKRWLDAGRQLGVAVNLSARSLTDLDFPDELDAMLRESGVPADKLTLEITETAMIGDGGRPQPTLRRLHALGVRLSVDDFGTGYSSFSYLRNLPVHEVKIDKSFIVGIATDESDFGIVRAIVDLGHHLGLSVVAEGVESEPTLPLLARMKCDLAQGYFFSRPLPAERLNAWIEACTRDGKFIMGEAI